MPTRDELLKEMLGHSEKLYAFAISLTGNGDRAKDLLQDTITSAIAGIESYARSSTSENMLPWLFTIMRNKFSSNYRKHRRMIEDPDGSKTASLWVRPSQQSQLLWQDFVEVFKKLPPEQSKALMLIAVEGCTLEEAASICGVPVGTIKSRIFRGRAHLRRLLPEGETAFVGAADHAIGCT